MNRETNVVGRSITAVGIKENATETIMNETKWNKERNTLKTLAATRRASDGEELENVRSRGVVVTGQGCSSSSSAQAYLSICESLAFSYLYRNVSLPPSLFHPSMFWFSFAVLA